jgi:hypothetical protein
MRPDNPNFRPCHKYGLDAVGPGWEQILVDLDHAFVMITGMGTDEHRKIEILQIKEKFGGLRIYCRAPELNEKVGRELSKAVARAEQKSFETCEVCGKPGNKGGDGWIKTFCPAHHQERNETGKSPLTKFWEGRDALLRTQQETERTASEDPEQVSNLRRRPRRRG